MSKESYPVEDAIRTAYEGLAVGAKITYAIAKPIFQGTGKVFGYYAGIEVSKQIKKADKQWQQVKRDVFQKNKPIPRFYKPER
jgi:hypothetical protein